MSDIRPFLSTLASETKVRPFGATLPVAEMPTGTSPWSPQPRVDPAPSLPVVDVAALRAEASAQGREEGLRETAALRATLTQLIDGLAAAQAEATALHANLIADAAATVIEAWIERTGTAATFLPLIRTWQARSTEPMTVHVHPSAVEALRDVIGDAAITIVATPALAPGALELRSASHELTHSWEGRLAELRETIIAALEDKS